jgi:hypothetical protein
MKEKTTDETFFADAMALVKEYMARDPEELRFSMMVLAPPSEYSVEEDAGAEESAAAAGSGAAEAAAPAAADGEAKA